MNDFLQPTGKSVLQGVLFFSFGLLLLLYTLGILRESVTVFMVIVAAALMAAGFFMAGFHETILGVFKRKKE